jgi:DNA (cytosine-5)-methyltransferase 1
MRWGGTVNRRNDVSSIRKQEISYTSEKQLTFIDLFSGCGGFTLGMLRAGFLCVAAIDFNAEAIETLKLNLSESLTGDFHPVENAFCQDLTKLSPADLSERIKRATVDVIVGGPPCQGFSTARQVDGANHGHKLVDDPRRRLYREFLKYVDFFQPRVFVMENVLGIRTAAGGEYFTSVQKEARELGRINGRPGYHVHPQVEDAWELGAPQKRRRQLIVGVRGDLAGYFVPELKHPDRAQPRTLLGAALGDLPALAAGSGENECAYDLRLREKYLSQTGHTAWKFLYQVLEVQYAAKLTNHVARPHSERDLRDFARLKEGENSATAIRNRSVLFEFPYNKSTFKDRYTRQSRWKACSTIVAHLSKDGLMFIHPTENRSLTPREAARVQTFPDWFLFPKARTQSFRLIGNAVPPLVGESVGIAIRKFLQAHHEGARGRKALRLKKNLKHLNVPITKADAARELTRLAQLDRSRLRALTVVDFLRGWHALLFLFPRLHPENARDHGTERESLNNEQLNLPGLENLFAHRYVRTGWPVSLELIGREAWRRYEAMQFNEDEFYCVSAQRAGLEAVSAVFRKASNVSNRTNSFS